MRPASFKHVTSLPYRFFGREAELILLDHALADPATSLVALIGPGGQGKTAIAQHWLESFLDGRRRADGVFLWSFYRGKDVELFLRELYAYAADLDRPPEVSAAYCVDQLLSWFRRETWVLILDGAEVVQHETGDWRGRFLHPELGRFVEELAMSELPGLVVLTTRFALPELERRKSARLIQLEKLDAASGVQLLRALGVAGDDRELRELVALAAGHAKAVELLGTYLTAYCGGRPQVPEGLAGLQREKADQEEAVSAILRLHGDALPIEDRDLAHLAVAFREPAAEPRLIEYLLSEPVARLLRKTWGRGYARFTREAVESRLRRLVGLRLLERVPFGGVQVIDAHPVVRRLFDADGGKADSEATAVSRAGFLRERPGRRRPESLEEARDEVELFYSYCEAGLWNEADRVLVALQNPKHRLLAPALERDLLLRFFPKGDWRRPPLWSGFGRRRSLAIALEMLGTFADAIEVYRDDDAALAGDALLALGRLDPILRSAQVPQPWQGLWQAYRAHALCLAGRVENAVALASKLVPDDIYEWVHVFECLLRAGALRLIDPASILYRRPHVDESRWSTLATERMHADYLRVLDSSTHGLRERYERLLEAYDRAGLPWERALTRLSLTTLLVRQREPDAARKLSEETLALARRFGMRIIEADCLMHQAVQAEIRRDRVSAEELTREAEAVRAGLGYFGPTRA